MLLAFGQGPRTVLRVMSAKTAFLPEASLFGLGLLKLAWVQLGTTQHRSMGSACILSTVLVSVPGWMGKGRQRYASPFTASAVVQGQEGRRT